ncbi:MAG: hypothetical protein P8Y28_09110, partial [Gammaproteobacteria bacterium]
KTGGVSLVTYDGRHIRIQNNGLNESGFDKQDLDNPPIAEYLLGLMPYFLHEDPKSAFVVGYGGGFTTKAFTLTEGLETIKVVELEPVIVDAGRYIYGDNIPMLQDPRLTLEFNDARNTLLLEDVKYDLIAAQPSHPWLSRASTVFTKEFFQVVKSRLNEGGIYGQWLSMFNMDATTMRAIMKAFYDVFPEGFTMADVNTGDFLLFGSEKPLDFELERVRKRLNEEKIKHGMAYFDLQEPQDLLWYFALSRDQAVEAAGDMVPNTDMNILSEVRLSALDRNATGDESPYKLLWDNYTLDAGDMLGDDAARIFYDYAQSLYRWDEFKLVHHTVNNLLKHDAAKARAVDHEFQWRVYDYDGAIALYEKNERWPDVTHQQQAEIMMELIRFEDAKKAIARIQDEKLRRTMQAKLLFKQGKLKQLSRIKPVSDAERAWQLTALAESNLKKAGKALVDLTDKLSLEEAQLRVLVRYFGSINDELNMNKYSRELVALIDNRAEQMVKALNMAIEKKAVLRARSLLTRIEVLKPNVKNLDDLRKKVDALENVESVKA